MKLQVTIHVKQPDPITTLWNPEQRTDIDAASVGPENLRMIMRRLTERTMKANGFQAAGDDAIFVEVVKKISEDNCALSFGNGRFHIIAANNGTSLADGDTVMDAYGNYRDAQIEGDL